MIENKLSIGVILSVLLLSFIVLIHNLDKTSLWADEGWTIAATTESNPFDTITEWVAEDVHPPMFFIELNLWRKLSGDTIFAMRYFAVLMSFVGVALMHRLGKAMFSERAGIIAALFFGLHDLVHVLAQEVRHYPQQQTATVVAIWMYWRFWQKANRNRGIAFALSGAILIYSHYWGGFVLLGMALHTLLTKRQQLRPYILAFMGMGVLYLPWLPTLYHQITVERPRGLPHALENSWTVYKTLAFQLAGVPEIFWLLLAGVGTLGMLRTKHQREWMPTAASGLPALIIILTVGMSLLVNTQYETLSFRSLAVVIPPLAILVGHALAQFREYEQFIMVVFLIAQSLGTTSAQPIERAAWPEAAQFVANHVTHNDLVLLEMDTDEFAFGYYLNQWDVVHISTEGERLLRPENFDKFLQDLLQNKDGIWLAKFGYFFYDLRPAIEANGFVLSAPAITQFGPYVDGRPIELWRYDRPAPAVEISFGDVMQLMRFSVTHYDEWVTINLLWSPTQRPERNFTISTFILTAVGFPTGMQHDSYPFEGRSPTLGWEAGHSYFDSHTLSTKNLQSGHYQVGLKVYYFVDTNFSQLEIATASDCSANPNCEYVILETIEVK